MSKENSKVWPAHLISTFFGVGHAPVAPGTFGSFAALPCAWGIVTLGGWQALAVASVIIFFLGWHSSDIFAHHKGAKDPGLIVIDEVAGQWIALLPAALDPILYLVSFFLFRLTDILKPFPASWADKKLSGGLGIMLDDVFAGVYAALGVYLFKVYGGPLLDIL